ncbi:MAG: phosphoribosylformylglycinamidine synthase I [Candidatus Omnitrophica bacterium CG1_02_49_10]|nr:MAG: phosphoribosylformylglycinamidine synthase I [Candidatus Omnitrophica bacterium CG1_02_49_10]
MKKVRAIVLRAAGTNCDVETAYALEYCGAKADLVHVNSLLSASGELNKYDILAIPGGFTYGDDISSGKILANELRHKLSSRLKAFIERDGIIIGICNGFQVLVKSGILPGWEGDNIEATLTINDSAKFEDRWVYLTQNPKIKNQNLKSKVRVKRTRRAQKCIWTKWIDNIIYLPVAHGEGKFIPKDEKVLQRLNDEGQIILRYVDRYGKPAEYPANPNGSTDDIAGICDRTGKVFGLMPHPERYLSPLQHPRWSREGRGKEGDGAMIFKNGVDYAKRR